MVVPEALHKSRTLPAEVGGLRLSAILPLAVLATVVFAAAHLFPRTETGGDETTALAVAAPAATQTVSSPPGERDTAASSGERRIAGERPAQQPLGSGRHPVRAKDFRQLTESYDALAARTLTDFNERYYGALTFHSEAEFRRLDEQAFPLPEEILDAAVTPEHILREHAGAGGEKAKFLYMDRLLNEMAALRQSLSGAGIGKTELSTQPAFVERFVETERMRSRIADSASPFAGYLLARYAGVVLDDPYGELAALLHAYQLGDSRAIGRAEGLRHRRGIGEQAWRALGAYASLLGQGGVASAGKSVAVQ